MPLFLIVQERAGRDRLTEPVTVGIPFPKATVFKLSQLSLCNAGGEPQPLQAQALARWIDGSIRWALLDFQATVTAHATTAYCVESDADKPRPLQPVAVSVTETEEHVIIDTGGYTFFINRRVCKPFDRIVVNGVEQIGAEGSSLVLIDAQGRSYVPIIDDLAIEIAGQLRTCIRAGGQFKSDSKNSLTRFAMRLSFHAGLGVAEMNMTVHNPRAARHPGGLWDLGDKGSIYFKDLSLNLPLRGEAEPQVTWTTQPLRQPRKPTGESVEIYQDSSGGENWRSTNHVNRFGKVMHSFRGYRVKSGDKLVEHGLRATPTVTVHGHSGGVAATMKQFWQNFPKAIEADKSALTIRLFPRQYHDDFELQGGEQKTHTVYLQFSGAGERLPELSWAHHRLIARASPEWYSGSKAISYLSPRAEDENVAYRELVDTAIDGPQSFFARREIIDEYGWRNFGDLYADHEAVGHTDDTPLVSHYNNQYDVIYGALIQYFRSGDHRWFELASDLARHIIDIDIYHTTEDRPAYSGGLFWHTDHYRDAGTATHRSYSRANLNSRQFGSYGGGPCNEHNYTTGLLHYYYLTGDETARDAVLGLADWVFRMDTPSTGFLVWLDRRATGLASSTTDRWYHGPGRGAGNSINALLDAYVLDHDQKYLNKAEELIRRCIHPDDDIRARCLDDPEHRWSYLVFVQALGKYLDVKIDARQIDFMFCYAQASLLYYAEWMVSNEVPYATVLDKVEIPTETWPAQDIRKSVVFDFAAKHASEPARSRFTRKADFFFEACIRDLRKFSTCTLVRPLALLLGNAHIHAYFVSHPQEIARVVEKRFDFGRPQSFKGQLFEVYRAREQMRSCVQAVIGAVRFIRLNLQKRQTLSRVKDA